MAKMMIVVMTMMMIVIMGMMIMTNPGQRIDNIESLTAALR